MIVGRPKRDELRRTVYTGTTTHTSFITDVRQRLMLMSVSEVLVAARSLLKFQISFDVLERFIQRHFPRS